MFYVEGFRDWCRDCHAYTFAAFEYASLKFHGYFGPSTIYPLLHTLQKKGYVKSEWNMSNERPRKVYTLTTEGQKLLNFTEDSVNLICRKLALEAEVIAATAVLAQK